jgi:FKBP-type peptidyl-prolyl cis-trans isomerase 2
MTTVRVRITSVEATLVSLDGYNRLAGRVLNSSRV